MAWPLSDAWAVSAPSSAYRAHRWHRWQANRAVIFAIYVPPMVAAGWSNATYTARATALAPLRDRPDYQALLAELFDRTSRPIRSHGRECRDAEREGGLRRVEADGGTSRCTSLRTTRVVRSLCSQPLRPRSWTNRRGGGRGGCSGRRSGTRFAGIAW